MKTLDEFANPAQLRTEGRVTILVVDDEAAVRHFAARTLKQDGFVVLEAVDGVEALELLESRAEMVDGILSDIVMPRMNGVELMQALAETHSYLPVILMSGYAAGELAELGIAAPCGMVPKPFSSERLIAEVRRCVGRPGGGVSAA